MTHNMLFYCGVYLIFPIVCLGVCLQLTDYHRPIYNFIHTCLHNIIYLQYSSICRSTRIEKPRPRGFPIWPFERYALH